MYLKGAASRYEFDLLYLFIVIATQRNFLQQIADPTANIQNPRVSGMEG